ncbi:hypothetical protein HNP86_001971 [Methanococcus maripaludis]|uniref:Uncharacterized protein n=1 Tax=Methanococcus maripaludis TaxID=39152 RepID=A0A7J9NVV1_METMI|nr:hypothetical protein [Methanococcus maripaludis]MBA2851812.1 hypothetical protein [Methanococcus maripaludis]
MTFGILPKDYSDEEKKQKLKKQNEEAAHRRRQAIGNPYGMFASVICTG